jgi:hypothetical protein
MPGPGRSIAADLERAAILKRLIAGGLAGSSSRSGSRRVSSCPMRVTFLSNSGRAGVVGGVPVDQIVTLLLTPLADAISSQHAGCCGRRRRRIERTTPSDVVRNADWWVPSVIQYKFRSTRPT